jgi:restriction system protein
VPLPTKDNLHLPLLKVLNDAGGSLSTQDAIRKVKEQYHDLTPDDLASRLDSGVNRLNNRIMWAKQDKVLTREIESGGRGVWRITDKGRQNLKSNWSSWKPEYSNQPTANISNIQNAPKATAQATSSLGDPDEAVEQARREIVRRVEAEVLERLHTVDPSDFENIIAQLLEKLEYGSLADGTIKVTGRSGDGGIDGECTLDRLGLYKAKFQAKRWTNQVSSKEVRDFIGGLTTERVEQGIFVTTSNFSADAVQTAQRAGKVKLINGPELARIMVEAGIGVRKTSLEIPKIDEEYFSGLA